MIMARGTILTKSRCDTSHYTFLMKQSTRFEKHSNYTRVNMIVARGTIQTRSRLTLVYVNLTVNSLIAGYTGTVVGVDEVVTGGAVLTWR